jgi:hypothetical protein
MRIEFYLHLPRKQHVPSITVLVEYEDRGRVYTHTHLCTDTCTCSHMCMFIFRCIITELWFCLWKVTRSQDIFQNQMCPLRIGSVSSVPSLQTPRPRLYLTFQHCWNPFIWNPWNPSIRPSSQIQYPRLAQFMILGPALIFLHSSLQFRSLWRSLITMSVCTNPPLVWGPGCLMKFVILRFWPLWVLEGSSELERNVCRNF